MSKYKWKHNLCVSADTVGEELEAIEQENGRVTKEAIVDRARPEDSPMHPLFEWNDPVAAEEYRKDQAHMIIRNLVIVIAPAEKESEPITFRAFPNANEDPTQEGYYVNIEKAMSDKEISQVLLKNALRELRAFQEKYKALKQLTPVFTVIDEIVNSEVYKAFGVEA